MKYLNAVITLKDAFTSVLGKIKKEQLSFVSDAKSVSGIVKDAYKLDPSDIKKAIKDINNQIEDNKNKLKEAQTSMTKWKELLNNSTPVVKNLSKEVQDLSLRKQRLIKEMDRLKTSGDTGTLNKYNSVLEDINKTLKDKTTSLSKAKSEQNKYTKELRESEKEVSKLDVSIGALHKKLKDLSSSKTHKKSFSLSDVSNSISNNYDKFNSEKGKYSGFDNLGNSIKGAGKTLSLGVSAPLSIGIGASLKVGMEFESQMSSVEATLGDKASIENMKLLDQKAIEMGASTTKSATESAQAMEYMALAGWDANQIIGGIEPILRLSEASKTDLATTSDLVTDSMSALGLEVGDLGGFLDKVSKTSTSANTSSIELMESFIVTGGKVKSLGADISEVSTILGTMANRGLKGAEAGRGLSAILTNLTSPTGQAKEALSDLNFSAFDAEGNFIGLENTFRKLIYSLEGMTQEQRVTYLSMIAGKEHGKTLEAILDGLSNEYTTLKDSIVNSDGALNTMAKTMQDNTAGTLAGFKSKLEDLGIGISQMVLPHLSSFVGFLSGIVDKFTALSPATQKNILIFGLLAIALPPVIMIIGGLINSVSTIAGGMRILKGTLISASQGVGLLGKAFTFLSSNPIVLVIGAIAGIILGIMHLWRTNEAFRDAIHNIWQSIVESVEWATNKIIDGINWIIDKINAIPFINIKTIGHVEWSEKSKNNSTRKGKDSVNMGDGLIAGSYKTGLSYVPYDGFIAELHKGERVLTYEENRLYSTLGMRDKTQPSNSIIKMINGNNSTRTVNNSTTTKNSNITINVPVNFNTGSNTNDIDINKLAKIIAKIIADKIREKKLNVV